MAAKPRIVLHNDKTAHLAARLARRVPGADFRECNSYEALPGLVADYQPEIVYSVRFGGSPGFPGEALVSSGSPKWIAIGGAGIDHLGIWDPARVTVTNSAGVAAGMMAEYILGGFLHFTLDVPGLQADKAGRSWNARTVSPLAGKTLLIIGLGHTGRALASRAKAFGMQVAGTRARPEPMEHVDAVHAAADLPALLGKADFIAVCTPLTDRTRGLLGEREFNAAKPGAILADVSRGGVIDQAALVEALRSGRLAAAILDVFETEPLPAENPLWALDNVLLSPHCSSVYEGWDEASFDLFLANLQRWMNGEPLENVVDPRRGY